MNRSVLLYLIVGFIFGLIFGLTYSKLPKVKRDKIQEFITRETSREIEERMAEIEEPIRNKSKEQLSEALAKREMMDGYFCLILNNDSSPYKAWISQSEPYIKKKESSSFIEAEDLSGKHITKIIMDSDSPGDSKSIVCERLSIENLKMKIKEYREIWVGPLPKFEEVE